MYSESIYDGEGTKYWRKSTGEWQSTAMNRKDPFPFSRESLCPDLDSIGSVAFQGEETIGGVVLRRYALDTTGFDWLVWIDSEGWLSQVRMVRLDPGAAAAGETAAEGLDITASISGRGEANTVTIPQVGQ